MPDFRKVANVKGLTKKRRYLLQKEFRDWPVAIAEGDSWTEYRREFTAQYDLVDHLGGVSFPYTLYPLGEAGAELKEMLQEEEWLEKIARVRPKFILFSGGGNDILETPALKKVLMDRKTLGIPASQPIPPGQVRGKLMKKVEWQDQLDKVKGYYNEVIRKTNAETSRLNRRRLPIVVHGYDHPIPNGRRTINRIPGFPFAVKGPWLKKAMDARHITRMDEKKAIVKILINDFNKMLKGIADASANFHYVNVRGTLGDFDVSFWADEIHPRTKGFRMIAAKIDRYIRTKNIV